VRRITWDDAVERRLARNQHVRDVQTIFLKVLVKMRLRPLPPSMSTLVSLTSATTISRTKANLPGSKKLVH
jgi:hypothetical protein